MLKVSICMPTRGRCDQAINAIHNVFATTDGHDVEMIVVSHPDSNDLMRLAALADRYPKLQIFGHVCTAIEGWNFAASFASGDFIKVYDDDLIAEPGWLDAVESTWKQLGCPEIAYFGLWDKHRLVPHELFTRAIGTRKFFTDVCGGVLTIPIFKSWYDDNAKFDLATKAGCAHYCPQSIIHHHHPAYGFPDDETYALGRSRHHGDEETYNAWKSRGCQIEWNPIFQ